MKVLKFGGTSVGTVESLTFLKRIVEKIDGPAIIVVSALGGVTDQLIGAAGKAQKGDLSYNSDFETIRHRHLHIISEMVDESLQEETVSKVENLLESLKKFLTAIEMISMLPQEVLDSVVSFGERLSSTIVTAIIEGSNLHDSLRFIKTEKWHGKNIVDTVLTNSLITEEFAGDDYRSIVPGFISTDKSDSRITNLGRGGSDYTAALIAAALEAEILEIWTDVDGFMTADPRVVKDALIIPELTFSEAMELCTFGAKVVYPPTIYPVFHKGIPIKILNTFNSEAPGTLIKEFSENNKIKGVTPLRNIALLTLSAESSEDINIKSRSLNIISKNGMRIFPVTNLSDNNFSFAVSANDAIETKKLLDNEFAPEISQGKLSEAQIKPDLSMIALVGPAVGKDERLAARIMRNLHHEGIGVHAVSQGFSETTAAFILNESDTEKSVKKIHDMIFYSTPG